MREMFGISEKNFSAIICPSFGQYVASLISGAISYENALKIVRERGRLQDKAVEGISVGMYAFNIPESAVRKGIEAIQPKDVCEISAIHNPKQTIVSGMKTETERLAAHLKEHHRAIAIPIKTSTISHCSVMKPVAEGLGKFMESIPIENPGTPVLCSFTGEANRTAEELRKSLTVNTVGTSNFMTSVRTAFRLGVRNVVEMGPKHKMIKSVLEIAKADGIPGVSVSHFKSDE